MFWFKLPGFRLSTLVGPHALEYCQRKVIIPLKEPARKLVSILVFINLLGTKVESISTMRARILLYLFTQGIDTSSAVFVIGGVDKKVFLNSSRNIGLSDESVCFLKQYPSLYSQALALVIYFHSFDPQLLINIVTPNY